MTRQEAEEKILDYLENQLPPAEREQFDKLLAEDTSLRGALDQHSKLILLEGKLWAAEAPLPLDLEVETMKGLPEPQALPPKVSNWRWKPLIGVVTMASLALFVTEFSFSNYKATVHELAAQGAAPATSEPPVPERSEPAQQQRETPAPPSEALNIPQGFRAVTVQVDSRSGIEGFAKPGSRVDTLLTFVDKDGKKKVATLARFIKILSAGGAPAVDGRAAIQGTVDVTLLTTERDAKRLELARNVGAISLTLVGGDEQGKVRDEDPASVDLSDITGVRDRPTGENPAQGYMYMRDPQTGRNVKFKLKSGGRWEKDDIAEPPHPISLFVRIDESLTEGVALEIGATVNLYSHRGEKDELVARNLKIADNAAEEPGTTIVEFRFDPKTKPPVIFSDRRYFLKLSDSKTPKTVAAEVSLSK